MLDWVYGYRGKDSRANLAKLPTGEVSGITFQLLRHIFSTEKKKILDGGRLFLQVVYYVASVVVLYSAEAHTQRHYRGHTEDIESICVHPQVAWP